MRRDSLSKLIGNYSKGLVHNSIGEVDSASYASLLRALNTGEPQALIRF